MKRNGILILKIALTSLLASLGPGAFANYTVSNEPEENAPAQCAQNVSNGAIGESKEASEFRMLLAEQDFWRCVVALECVFVHGGKVIADDAKVKEMFSFPIERRLDFLHNLPLLREALSLRRLYANMGLMPTLSTSNTTRRRKTSRSEADD